MGKKIAIVGNSGSGKSTLAKTLAGGIQIRILDLDTIAWEPNTIAVPRALDEQLRDVHEFCVNHDQWVVEGCYASLIEATTPHDPHLVVLDPGVDQCIANCKSRPWEAHKYASKEEQDSKLDFLLEWVEDYYHRDDDMSLAAHQKIYAAYTGHKTWLTKLPDGEFSLNSS